MKVETYQNGNKTGGICYKFSEFGGVNTYPLYLYLDDDVTNCKLSYIHGAGNLMSLTDLHKKEVVEWLLRSAKGAVIFNTTNKKVADYIAALYPVYYYIDVPIGYGSGFQYHICVKNTIKVNGNCRTPKPIEKPKPIETKVVEVPAGKLDAVVKDSIKKKLLLLLKLKRRKNDYVDGFIESL